MKTLFPQIISNSLKKLGLVFWTIISVFGSNLDAQNTENIITPIKATLSVANFNQNLRSFDLLTSVYTNSDINDFKVDIQSASFVEQVGSQSIIEPEIKAGHNIQLKSTYTIRKNSSFKIKVVFSGIKLPQSINFETIEYYYFLYNGSKFEIFNNLSQSKTLKSVTSAEDLRVFNRVEAEDIKINVSKEPILKSAPYTFNVSGEIGFKADKDAWHPVRYAMIKVFDKELLTSTQLGVTATDEYGNYSINITSTEANGPDIYIEVLTEGLENIPKDSKGIAVVQDYNLSSNTYYADTKDVIRDNTIGNITISFTIPNSGSDAGSFYIFDSFVEGWLKSKQYFSISIDKANVFWPRGDKEFAANYGDKYIEIGQSRRYDRDVHLHEYAHYIDTKYTLTNMNGGIHNITNLTGTTYDRNGETITRSRVEAVGTAMGEGWATFFAVASQYSAVNNDTQWDIRTEIIKGSEPGFLPLEADAPSPYFPNVQGADHELAVSRILWDIFDAANEPHDNLNEGLTEVWRVLIGGNIDAIQRMDSIQQFATRWQALNKGNLIALSNIYLRFGIKIPIVTDPTYSSIAWNIGSSHNITWSGFNGPNVKIELYKGLTPNSTIISSTINNGSFSWTVPTSQTSGTDYKIKITSISDANSVDISDNNFTIAQTATLNPPRNLTATAGNGQVSLSWSAPTSGTPTNYTVYRSTSESGTYTTLTPNATSVSYTATGLTNETTYWFKVKAYYSSGSSDFSTATSAKPTSGIVYNPPSNLSASAGNGQITLSWSKPSSGNPSSYNVYKGTSENGPYSFYDSSPTSSKTVTGLTNGTTYWFYITAVYPSDISGASTKVSVVPIASTLLSNDEPCNADLLTVQSSCNFITKTIIGATKSTQITDASCDQPSNVDVWFKFTIPSGKFGIHTNSVSISGNDCGLAIYTGSCSSLAERYCTKGGNPSQSYMPWDDNVDLSSYAGQTGYIRMWEYGTVSQTGDFQICVTGESSTNNCTITSLSSSSETYGSSSFSTTPGADDIIVSGQPNCTFTVSESCPWLTVTPMSGTMNSNTTGTIGQAFINYSIQENETTIERVCTFYINGNPVTIKQNGAEINDDDFYITNVNVPSTNLAVNGSVSVSCDQCYSGSKSDSELDPTNLGYYLSTNASFDSNDILLATDGSGLGSDDPCNTESATLTIPGNTTPGSYYILFVADHDKLYPESNENNNVVAIQISVTSASHDFYILNESVLPDKLLTTGLMTINCDLCYSGSSLDAEIGNCHLGYYFSTDKSFNSSSDTYLGSYITGIGSDNPIKDLSSSQVSIPAGTAPGIYYILLVADYDGRFVETNENNNVEYVQITVVGNSFSEDLYIQNSSISSSSVVAGESIDVTCTQCYIGSILDADMQSSIVGYYLSTNTSPGSPNDIRLGTDGSSLGSDYPFESESATLTIPVGTTPGNYYILFVADYDKRFSETNETNNVSYIPIYIKVNCIAPSIPTIESITHPTCTVATGSVVLNGLPAIGTWTLTKSPGGETSTGTGTSKTIASLATGSSNYTVTDAAGCISTPSASVVINPQPSPLTAPIVGQITNPTCTVSTGSVILSGLPASGSWTLTRTAGGATLNGTGASYTVSGIAAGTYTYTYTNAAGCTSLASANVVINAFTTSPTPPVVGAITHPTCTLATGSVVLSGLPAIGTWTLTKTPGGETTTGTGTSKTLSGLAAGTYTYAYKNESGCNSIPSANLVIKDQPVTPTAPLAGTVTQPTCTLATGSVVLNDLPATGTWIINPGGITGNGTSKTITSLSSETYSYTVTDASGCTSNASASITIYAQPSKPATPTASATLQPNCEVSTGTITVTLPTGSGMTYSIDGLNYTNTDGIFTLVPAGTYTVTARNEAGCISEGTSVTIDAHPPTPATPAASATLQPSCEVSTGTITVTSPTGSGMTYSINGMNYTNTTGIFTLVPSGTYLVSARSAADCTSDSTSVTITAQPPKPANPTATATLQPTCTVSTGTITVTAPTGAGMTYSINGSAYTNTTGIFTLVPAGTYNVTARNATGCTSPGTNVTITTQPVTPTPPVLGILTQPAKNVTTGSVVLNGLPVTGSWTLTTTPGGTTTQGTGTSKPISGLTAGTYSYTVTNASGCMSVPSANVVIYAQPATPTDLTTSSCNDLVTLKWSQNADPNFKRNRIYRGTTSNPTTQTDSTTGGISETLKIISGFTRGQMNYFRITAVNNGGAESNFSMESNTTVKSGVIPEIKAKWGDLLICYNLDNLISNYQWYKGSALIPNAIGQYYSAEKQAGIYLVETIDKDGCKNSSNTIQITAGTKSLTVYPNPASVSFALKLMDTSELKRASGESVNVSLINSSGQKVLELQARNANDELLKAIPVSNLVNGVYIVQVLLNNAELHYIKIVVLK